MGLAEVDEDGQHDAPNSEEEDHNKYESLPLRDSGIPEEAPVPSIWLESRFIIVHYFSRERGKRTPLSQ
jgi:hypothetical protein